MTGEKPLTEYQDKVFENMDFARERPTAPVYEDCIFKNCSFATACLDDVQFIDCRFESCNLSGAGLKNTAFRNTVFEGCKMLGLRFDECNPLWLEISFSGCQLDLSSFYKTGLPGTRFRDCSLREVDFCDADLSGVRFDGCDMEDARFERCNLEKADLRTARNFSIDPESNRLKKARFSPANITGLLGKYDIRID